MHNHPALPTPAHSEDARAGVPELNLWKPTVDEIVAVESTYGHQNSAGRNRGESVAGNAYRK